MILDPIPTFPSSPTLLFPPRDPPILNIWCVFAFPLQVINLWYVVTPPLQAWLFQCGTKSTRLLDLFSILIITKTMWCLYRKFRVDMSFSSWIIYFDVHGVSCNVVLISWCMKSTVASPLSSRFLLLLLFFFAIAMRLNGCTNNCVNVQYLLSSSVRLHCSYKVSCKCLFFEGEHNNLLEKSDLELKLLSLSYRVHALLTNLIFYAFFSSISEKSPF